MKIDQCDFGLRGPGGGLHRKPTMILTSSAEVYNQLEGRVCSGDHEHEHVLGGSRVTEAAGHYPPALAKAFMTGIVTEFDKLSEVVQQTESSSYEAFIGEGTGDSDEDGPDDGGDDGLGHGLHTGPEGQDPAEELRDDEAVEDAVRGAEEPTPAERKMALHLHSVTGHRSPMRLARALVLTGASASLIRAVKELKCEVCHELQPVKTRRPASLPRVRNFGDRVYADLIAVQDRHGTTYWICHAVDACTRYQVARVLTNKSAPEVVKFFNEAWFQPLGIPSAVTLDMGTEFISETLMRFMEFHDVAVYHIPVEAPWENGIAERAGGSLKVVLRAVMHEASAIGEPEVQSALSAALEAVNGDVEVGGGYSPAQLVLGKQPRTAGAAEPSSFRSRLPSLSMQVKEDEFARLGAMREMAKLAMVRLHYSQALRRASVARPRDQPDWGRYSVGDVVYFFREQKATPKKKSQRPIYRKRLQLRSWHGPGAILALEGGAIPIAAYVAYRGNVTKVAMEHLRHASALERLSASDWNDILQDVINGAGDGGPRDAVETGGDAHGEADGGGPPGRPGAVPGERPGELHGGDLPRDDRGEVLPEALPAPRRRQVEFQAIRRRDESRPVVYPYPFPQELVAPGHGPSPQSSLVPSRMPSRQVSGVTGAELRASTTGEGDPPGPADGPSPGHYGSRTGARGGDAGYAGRCTWTSS